MWFDLLVRGACGVGCVVLLRAFIFWPQPFCSRAQNAPRINIC
jgi:hypothetical protein